MQDWQLLHDYVKNGSQEAFRSLVERYINLVYSVCLREVSDADLAADVTQNVFLILAAKARTMGEETVLSGWLFRTARFVCKDALRQEARRRRREPEVAQEMMRQLDEQHDQTWADLEPLLHDGLDNLNAAERHALLLRFFADKSLRETGEALGVSEEAARKRVARGLEKLRGHFKRHGFAVPVAALADLMHQNAVSAAPAHCLAAAAAIESSGAAALLAATSTQASWQMGAHTFLALSKFKIAAVGVAGLVMATTAATLLSAPDHTAQAQKSAQRARQAAQEKLPGAQRELQTASSKVQRFHALGEAAKVNAEAGNHAKARAYASDLLALAPKYRRDWNYGNALHDGHMVLGRVALHNGNMAEARRRLRLAGQTPGSAQLNSFGPNMSLARDLLQKGEKKAVLQYFDACRSFWKMGRDKLDAWKIEVQNDKTPDFGANLIY